MQFDATKLIGMSIVDVVRDVLPSVLFAPPENDIVEDRIYSTFKRAGFGLVADLSGKIVGVQLYSGEIDGLEEYRKDTPGEVSFSDDYRTVRSKLGPR